MKKSQGNPIIIAVAMALILAVVSCTPKGANAIVGKWAQGTNTSVTFTRDGTMSTTEDGKTTTGKYYITNGNTLALSMEAMPLTIMFTMEFPSDQELVLTMQLPKEAPAGLAQKPEHFKRVSN